MSGITDTAAQNTSATSGYSINTVRMFNCCFRRELLGLEPHFRLVMEYRKQGLCLSF